MKGKTETINGAIIHKSTIDTKFQLSLSLRQFIDELSPALGNQHSQSDMVAQSLLWR